VTPGTTIADVTPTALENELRQLHTVARQLRRDGRREVWSAPLQNKSYELWFYPRGGRSTLARFGAGTAAGDFSNLQLLQDRKVPSVRAVAMLAGFRFGDRIGDAVLVDLGASAARIDKVLFGVNAPPVPDVLRRRLLDGIIAVLKKLGDEKLGHNALSPAAFAFAGDAVRLCEPAGVTREGLTEDQLWQMAHAFGGVATTADRVRLFRRLTPEARLPTRDARAAKRFASDRKSDSIEPLQIGEWRGRFRTAARRPAEWSLASTLSIAAAEWRREWPLLVERVAAGQVEILKSDASGDVLATEVRLAGRPVAVVIKRPRNKYLYRRLLAVTRSSRAMRMWEKTVALHLRHLPIEYPLVVMERRRLGYAAEAIAVFERVPGDTLAEVDLNAMTPRDRERFFFRCGRALRLIEQTGLAHPDAKSVNWIAYRGRDGLATPVMLDAYGVRRLTSFLQLRGLRRLLRAMRQHPQYTPADSLEICRGFAPRAAPSLEAEA
jgi:hypothetical protein